MITTQHLTPHSVIMGHQKEIDTWFDEQWRKTTLPLYGSVDLRNAGFKLAPIDTNLFPAGFNNLNANTIPSAAQTAKATIAEICPNVTRLLLIPENHSRNLFYFESVATLLGILCKAGFDVKVASPNPQLINLPSGRQLTLEAIVKNGNRVAVGDFDPQCIILNNDLSDGIPEILQNLEQRIIPSLHLGWSKRLKSIYFDYYQTVCKEFSLLLNCDPWFFNPLFSQCPEVNFMTQEGQECLYHRAQKLLHEIRYKYDQYNIQQKPFLVIKADSGTYGMAVMMIEDPEELLTLNRKQRTRMSTIKGGKPVTKAIIQEGIYSFEKAGVANSAAEPVVYCMGRETIGGFYRIHKDKAENESLNSPGMTFSPFDTETLYPYKVIAELAMLAAAREMKEIEK